MLVFCIEQDQEGISTMLEAIVAGVIVIGGGLLALAGNRFYKEYIDSPAA